MVPQTMSLWKYLLSSETDPPVPPGATKFSYSVRFGIKLSLPIDTTYSVFYNESGTTLKWHYLIKVRLIEVK